MKIIVPVEEKAGLESRISDHFGRASFYAIIEIDPESSDVKMDFIENPRVQGVKPGQYFAQLDIDYIVIKEGGGIGSRALEFLRQKGIEIIVVNAKTVGDVIRSVKEGAYSPYSGSGCPGKR